jgi:hypothetical protein
MALMVDRKCKCCAADMRVRLADVKRGWGLYCSKSCKARVQERKNGQHRAYLNGRGVSNLHPERLEYYAYDDTHPFSSDGLGQWLD